MSNLETMEKGCYYTTTAYMIGAIVFVVLIGVIGFVIGYKIKKKRGPIQK